MFSCLAGPAILVRLCVEVFVALFGFLHVLKVDRQAGLLIGAAGTLAAGVSILVPILEALGLYGMVSTSNSPGGTDLGVWIMLGTMLAGWATPLGQALDLALVMGGVWRLIRRIPEDRWEQREVRAGWAER